MSIKAKQFAIILVCVFAVSCKTSYSPAPLAIKRTAPSAPTLAAPAPTTKSVTLAWDANGWTLFRLYYGGRSGSYTNLEQTINTIQTVGGLIPKATYYFAVVGVSPIDGSESAYSNEVTYHVPGKRAKLVTEQTVLLASGSWTPIATNYDETTNNSGFYRVVVTVEE